MKVHERKGALMVKIRAPLLINDVRLIIQSIVLLLDRTIENTPVQIDKHTRAF